MCRVMLVGGSLASGEMDTIKQDPMGMILIIVVRHCVTNLAGEI